MSKPRFRWWQYAIKMVQDYPELNDAINLSEGDQRDRNAVAGAIETTIQQPQGEQRMTLIDAVYWGSAKRTIKEAAAQLSIADTVAESWHGEFIREVGKCWGFHTDRPIKQRKTKREKEPGETETVNQSLRSGVYDT